MFFCELANKREQESKWKNNYSNWQREIEEFLRCLDKIMM